MAAMDWKGMDALSYMLPAYVLADRASEMAFTGAGAMAGG